MSEWQPIETAPKGATARTAPRVLLAEGSTVYEGSWCAPYDDPELAGWYPSSYSEDWQMREYGCTHPTHWMPLPKPPK